MKTIDESIRDLCLKGSSLTDTAIHLRSCGCFLIELRFDGLLMETLEREGERLVNLLEKEIKWDIIYLQPFPGTAIVGRITFRKLCRHCLENYRLDGTIGMGTVLFRDKLKELIDRNVLS